MRLNKLSIENKYDIPNEMYMKQIRVIENYLEKIENLYLIENQSLEMQLSLIGVASELLPILKDKELWLQRIHLLLLKIKLFIEKNALKSCALHNGLANIGIYISILRKNVNCYSHFLNVLNEQICKNLKGLCEYLSMNHLVFTHGFDVITGVSGTGNYLLQFAAEKEIHTSLVAIIEYLIEISKYICLEGVQIPGWYIDVKNEPSYNEYATYGEGYINYSLSHGVGGILAFLTNAYKKGVVIGEQRLAIERIVNEYMRLNAWSDGKWWSGIISKKNYIERKFSDRIERQSWCNGNVSVLFVLYKTAKILEDNKLEKDCYNNLKEISQQEIQKLGIYSPIICHGLAGIITVFRVLYEETREACFYNIMQELMKKLLHKYNRTYLYGFRDEKFPQNGIVERKDDNSFLDGSAGIIMEIAAWIKRDSYFEHLLM